MNTDNGFNIMPFLQALFYVSLPIIAVMMAVLMRRYEKQHPDTVLGSVFGLIAAGIEQKYGNSLRNDQKRAMADEALCDPELRRELVKEGAVAVAKGKAGSVAAPQTVLTGNTPEVKAEGG